MGLKTWRGGSFGIYCELRAQHEKIRCPFVRLLPFAAFAPAADWLTDGGDLRRNNWQKDETILTKANVRG